MRIRFLLLITLLGLGLAGCGQTGRLYLPESPESLESPESPESTLPQAESAETDTSEPS